MDPNLGHTPAQEELKKTICVPSLLLLDWRLPTVHISLNCTLASYFKPSRPYLLCSMAMFYGFKFYGFFVLFFYYFFCKELFLPVPASSCP